MNEILLDHHPRTDSDDSHRQIDFPWFERADAIGEFGGTVMAEISGNPSFLGLKFLQIRMEASFPGYGRVELDLDEANSRNFGFVVRRTT